MLQEGTVKWFDNRKGIGFIEPREGDKDIFVHYKHIKGNEERRVSLDDGQEVQFEILETEKGLMATNVESL